MLRIYNFLRTNKILTIFLSFIAFLAILSPLTFFSGDKLLMGMDGLTPIRPSFRLYDWFYLWSHYFFLGDDLSSRVVNLPTQILPFVIFEKIGFSLVASQKIFFILIFLIAGFSMFFLTSTLFDNFKNKYFISFTSAIFYMFNPFIGFYWVTFLPEAIFCYAITPLILAFFVKGLKSKNYLIYAILFGLSTFFYPAVNPPIYIVVFMALIAFFFYFLVVQKEKLRVIKFLLWSTLFFLIINFWWLGIEFKFYLKVKDFYKTISEEENRLQSTSLRASFLNIFRLQGNNYSGFSFWGEKPNNLVGFLYETKPFLLFTSIFYTLMAFTSVFFLKKKKLILFLGLTALIFIFLSKGVHPPFELIYKLFYRLPLFNIFRSPSEKFPIAVVLFFAFLVGLSNWLIYKFLLQKTKLIAGIVFVLMIIFLLANQWYFFTGDAVHRGRDAQPSIQVKIPDYYWQAAKWLSKKDNFFRILNLPGADYSTRWLNYDWGFLGVHTFLSEILKKPIVDKTSSGNFDSVRIGLYSSLGIFNKLPYEFLNIPINNSIYKFLGLLGIKEIMVSKDIDWQHPYYRTKSPELIEQDLKKQENISFDKSFGKLYFYKLDEKFSLPHIYSPKSLARFKGNKLSIPLITSLEAYQFGEVLFEDKDIPQVNNFFIVLEPKNKIQEKQIGQGFGIKNFDFEIFPFSRWSPKNIIFPLVLKKEEIIKSSISNPKEKLEFNLSLAGKRISEIGKWRSVLSQNDWLKNLQLYKKEIDEVFKILESLKSNEENLALFFTVEETLQNHEEYLLNLIKNDKSLNKRIILALEGKIFGEIFEKINNYRLIRDNNKVVYKLDIKENEGGFYNLYVRDENFSPFLSSGFATNLKLEINNSEIPLKGKVGKDDWVDMGEIYLSHEQKDISLKMPEAINLFDNQNWQTNSKDFYVSNDGLIFKESNVHPLNEDSKNYIFQKIKNFEPNALFEVSFDYEAQEGNLEIAFIQDTDYYQFPGENLRKKRVSPVFYRTIYFGTEKQKRHFRTILRSSPEASSAEIYLIFSTFGDHNAFFQIRNLQVKRIFEPKVILKKKISDKELNQPQIKFEMVNPTKYKIEVEGVKEDFCLVFSETFSPDWQIRIGKKIIPKERHLLANGYANSWHLKPEDSLGAENYIIYLEYKPQKFFYLSLIFSGASLFLILVFLPFYYFKKKKDD